MKKARWLSLCFVLWLTAVFCITSCAPKAQEDMKLVFLKSYGDIKAVEGDKNGICLSLILYHYDDRFEKKEVVSDNGIFGSLLSKFGIGEQVLVQTFPDVSFVSDDIEVVSYKLMDTGTRNKDARLFNLDIFYKLNGKTDAATYEVNRIRINDREFDIGSLYFFPVSGDENKDGDLVLKSVSAAVFGTGLKDFLAELGNDTQEDIVLEEVDLRHFEDFKAKFILGDGGRTTESDSAKGLKIGARSVGELRVEFTKAPEGYDVFYVSPVIRYYDTKKELKEIPIEYFLSGSIMDEKELGEAADKYRMSGETLAD